MANLYLINCALDNLFLIFILFVAITERRSRKFSPNHNQNDENDSTVMLRNMPIQSNNPIHQFNHIPQPTAMTNSNPIKDKKKSNRKLTKADISMPTNFKHIVHVGWSAQTGFDLKGEEASSLNAFLEKAGVSEQQLNDRDTRAFIYDFIQHNNVLDSVKLEEEQDPPPVPSRQHVSRTVIWRQTKPILILFLFLIVFNRMVPNVVPLHHLRHPMLPVSRLSSIIKCRQESKISVVHHLVDHHRLISLHRIR